MLRTIFLTAAILGLFSSESFALSVETFKSAGNGCKATEQSADVATDSQTMTVKFKPLSHSTTKRLSRLNCSVSISLKSEPGKQFRITSFSGKLTTGPQPPKELSTEFAAWFQGQEKTARVTLDDLNKKFTDRTFNLPTETEWSPCQEQVTLNVAFSSILKTKEKLTQENAVIGLKEGLVLPLVWRACKS